MSKIHKTAMGRPIDMAALRMKNENVRAVGNMNVNARGDIIDSNNNVISDNSKRVNAMYEKTMMAAARGRAKQEQAAQPSLSEDTKKSKKKTIETQLTAEEEELLREFNEPNPKK
jgi:hypothetical protein